MSEGDSQQQAQLDKEERELLEEVVIDLREIVEDEVEYELDHQYFLTDRETNQELFEEKSTIRSRLIDAIEHENPGDKDWDWCYNQYITGVGYTIVNRLAAFRCMEVRGFLDQPVTQIGDSGLTPAAEQVLGERFDVGRDEALIAAYYEECERMEEEIEILFNLDSPYSVIKPEPDLFRDIVEKLDEIPDDVWRADDVLGWIYEYYNRPIVEALDAKNSLEPEDVGPANQFYTPHWVVRMLTDNSLGKLYLEATNQKSLVPEPGDLSVEERKERSVTPETAPDIPELCTYLIPDEEDQDAPAFEDPSELRIIDPACGSGHFLLYAFDVLERIWWAERPSLDRSQVPAKIIENNLYGVDIDLRSCQLAAFNLYLKGRARTEAEDGTFEMPNVGIVCADSRVAEVEEAVDALYQILAEGTEVRDALDQMIKEFQTTEALGSLLNVEGTLSEELMEEQTDVMEWGGEGPHTLNEFLRKLETAVDERTSDSFSEQNLRSFLNLLVVLTQDYDVALMNPPYGSGGRMPDDVQEYVNDHYEYTTEYYINFFEVCDRLVRRNGRIGMLVPWSFMFNKSFQDFREDFVGSRGAFDFFSEFGYDILDNATVGTVGTVVRSDVESGQAGTFIRLPDVDKAEKEQIFLNSAFNSTETDVQRIYHRDLSEFNMVPGTPLSYWVPTELRELYQSEAVLDADNAGLEARETYGVIKQGLATADDSRFVRDFWEVSDANTWPPFAKGGADAWILPRIKNTVLWEDDGAEIKRYWGSRPQNTQFYFNESLTYTVAKRSGRRFGYLHESSVFGHKGSVLIPDRAIWNALSYTNSHLFTYLMLTQTSERMWEVGFVSKVPWREELESIDELAELSREAVGHLVSKRQYEFVSPYYNGPVLLDILDVNDQLPQYDHPHRGLRENLVLDEPAKTVSTSASLDEIGIAAARHREQVEEKLQSCAAAIDEAVFDCFDITDDQRETVLQEIALRTIEDPRERETHSPEAITEPPEDFPEMVKDLLLHFTIRAVNDDEDGIVPIMEIGGEDSLLSRIEAEFERVFDEDAPDRLSEVDKVLGSQTAGETPYPNVQDWLENDLFEYHISKFDRTPILWRLTTKQLVSNGSMEAFGCLIDYHQLDAGILDRLESTYLESRRQTLRDRRNAANRRRDDPDLSSREQTEAAEEFERYQNALNQLAAFEEQLESLATPSTQGWPTGMQKTARDASEMVREFREQTETRLELLDELVAIEDVDMEGLFTTTFYDKVQKNREEWTDALEELERAFEAYGNVDGDAIEAHLYDLFTYYDDDLIGSSHFGSNGILFMTWYFDDFEPIDQTRLGEMSKRERILGELAQDLEEYKDLADDISEACVEVRDEISDEWSNRALDEITAIGYRPNHKHGVAINIAPLAEHDIVPNIVDEKVL